MKLRTKDKVQVISGKDKGKEGTVERVLIEDNKVVVHGINIAKRHVKPGKVSKEGGIISIEKPIFISNLLLICPKCKKTTKIAFKMVDGKKYRVCKKCGNTL